MKKKINIAIDGHSSCGKSTLAKGIAARLGYKYIDSGAMYRCVSLYCIQNDIDINDDIQIRSALDDIDISLLTNKDGFRILLHKKDVTARIKQMDVSNIVSEIAAKSYVRKKLVELQQNEGIDKGVVMDGRDIGTVVFPDAEIKFFVTAHIDVRSDRRYKELSERGSEVNYNTVKKNLSHRDHIDSTREDSPLIMAEDAILIDNSYMTKEEQLFITLKIINEKRMD